MSLLSVAYALSLYALVKRSAALRVGQSKKAGEFDYGIGSHRSTIVEIAV